MKNTPKIVILNQELVRDKLRQKKYDEVCLSSWGHLDEFIQFITSFGIFSMLAQLGLTTGHSGLPVTLLAMLAFVKPLFGIKFDDNIKYLFQDRRVGLMVGSGCLVSNFAVSGRGEETTTALTFGGGGVLDFEDTKFSVFFLIFSALASCFGISPGAGSLRF